VINNVAGENELAFLRAQVVRRNVVRVFEAQFRANQDGGADPMSPAQKMLGILCAETGALAANVVEVFVANGKIIVR
jgi:hypothetical protein